MTREGLKFYFRNSQMIIIGPGARGLLRWMTDEQYILIMYRIIAGKFLNISCPKSFNEKLQWLKTHDHNSKHTQLVNKYLARDYIVNELGEQYLIPWLGVWKNFCDIDFSCHLCRCW